MRTAHVCTALATVTGALLNVLVYAPPPAAAAPRLGACTAGALCLWEGAGFKGTRHTHELSDTDIESCVRLDADAASFANRTGRPVTVYQSQECAETGEFSTYPSGSWTPEGEYVGRAIKIWEH